MKLQLTQAARMRAVAAEIRSDPSRWTRAGALGYTATGKALWDEDEDIERLGEAVCLCAVGFCRRDGIDTAPLRKALGGSVERWNDVADRTALEVAEVFEVVAASLEVDQ